MFFYRDTKNLDLPSLLTSWIFHFLFCVSRHLIVYFQITLV